jgi:hypothetical protein
MASYSEPRISSFKQDGVVSAYLAVKPGTDAEHVAVASAATDKIIGIQQCASTAAEDIVEVAMPGGGGKAKLGGTVSFGDYLTADSDGKLIATTTANNKVCAQAMSDGVANDVIPVEVLSFNY